MKVKIYKLFSENYDKCYINYTTLCTGDVITNLKRKFIKKEEHPTNILFEKGVKCEILIRNLNFESVKDIKNFLYEYRKNFNVIENKQPVYLQKQNKKKKKIIERKKRGTLTNQKKYLDNKDYHKDYYKKNKNKMKYDHKKRNIFIKCPICDEEYRKYYLPKHIKAVHCDLL